MTVNVHTATYEEAVIWMRTAQPGSQLTYHIGDLFNDRRKSRATREVAEYMMSRADASDPANPPWVHLIQRRIGEGVYEYIAIRRRVSA